MANPKVCVSSGNCSCFQTVLVVSDCKFDAMNSNVKPARKKCTDQEVTGSFGDCRVQERKVAYYCKKCKAHAPTTITTKV